MTSWDRGEMKDGRLAVRLLALKILEMRLVLVRRAAYTTVKQNPAPNLKLNESEILTLCVVINSYILNKKKTLSVLFFPDLESGSHQIGETYSLPRHRSNYI